MSEQYSIYLQRRKLELVGILWLNNTRGHISSAFTADHNAALNILAAGRAVITSPVKQEPPKAVIANAVVAAGNPPPSGGGGRQDLETSHPGEKPPMLHTCIIDEESVLNVNTALEVAEFFRLRASEAKERLSEIRKAVSYWREEALRVNARSVEIAVMKETYEYCL